MMNIKIRGLNKTIARFNRLHNLIVADSNRSLESACNILRDGAIQKLNQVIGTGRWGSWGKSNDSIRDISNWKVSSISPSVMRLSSESAHSAVVEFGTIGAAFVESSPPDTPYPIGKQQGYKNPIYSYRFAVQKGYHYLTNAMNDKSIQNRMTNEIAKNIRNSIMKVSI